ncbi:hypothetical protein [Kitasatospora sp. NPDC057198]|uniref:hypothetical protein n=1 Tax=Kitasatospora sp. NPDC057198 TaxID=3346046 RepID=UPI0036324B7A
MVAGDGVGLAEAVVDGLLRPDGAAGAALDAEAVARVRHELHRLPRWQQVLEAAEGAPQDAAARAALTGAVDEVLGFNSVLEQSLRTSGAGAGAGSGAGAAPSFAKAAAPAAPAAPPGPPAPPSAAPVPPPAPPTPPAPPAPPGLPGAPAYPGLPPVDPAVLAKRKRIALGVGAVVVVGGLILLGTQLFGGDDVPTLPGSVEGETLRASSVRGDIPNWGEMSGAMAMMGVREPQAAMYGSVPEVEADDSINGSDRKERWSVIIAKSSPAFRSRLPSMAESGGSGQPHLVDSGLGGTMYCDSYDPDDSPRTRASEEITCLWADDEYMISVTGTGVDESLPAKILVRVHAGHEH